MERGSGGAEAYLASLLKRAWEPGEHGKALVLSDGSLRTWRTMAFGSPHHSDGQRLLNIAADAVVAHLVIEPDGEVLDFTATPTPRSRELTTLAVASDSRLHLWRDDSATTGPSRPPSRGRAVGVDSGGGPTTRAARP